MSAIPIEKEKHYTFEEWLNLDRPKNVWKMELTDGKIYMMGYASWSHQSIVTELTRQLANYLHGKRCKAFVDLAVRLEKDTIYIPDLAVVCDLKKLHHHIVCTGAPDLIIEILSPSTRHRDRITKLKAYRKAGVKEYWIVDPAEQSVTVHFLVNDFYAVDVYSAIADKEEAGEEVGEEGKEDKIIPVKIFPDFEIDLTTVFQEETNEED